MSARTPLAETLQQQTMRGTLCHPLADDWVQCVACGHACRIPPAKPGICKVRYNDGGTLRVPAGYVAGLQCDPIEKKPFWHVLPGSEALSFGMLGCDLHCSYCQNWVTSQALRDPDALAPMRQMTPAQIVHLALEQGAPTVASTYNEPLITAEWAVQIFQAARAAGLRTAFISNGNATPEALEFLRPCLDFYKVDLKSFRDPVYRKLGGRLAPILDTIPRLVEMGFWVEIVTLVVPGLNDSDEELGELARFLAGVSPDLPWHVSAFHADYKMTEPPNTQASALIRACEIGSAAGLHYVYAGNLPGQIGDWEDTRCPQCHTTLITRCGYRVLQNAMQGSHNGACPRCGYRIAGIWH